MYVNLALCLLSITMHLKTYTWKNALFNNNKGCTISVYRGLAPKCIWCCKFNITKMHLSSHIDRASVHFNVRFILLIMHNGLQVHLVSAVCITERDQLLYNE